jgi:glucokinase
VRFASYGGHAYFAPRSERETGLLRHLAGRFGHVSYERVVSGPGLVNVFEYLRDGEGLPVPPELAGAVGGDDAAAAITKAALAGTAPIAVTALDLFVGVYGAEAGNLALKLKALGGVFVGGGIAPKILPKLTDGTFRAAFLDKGRFAGLLADVPVQVVLEERAGLFGAARFGAIQTAA